MTFFNVTLALILAYMAGCINPAYYATRYFKHKDLRKLASGTLGARNTYRNFGVPLAMGVLLFDLCKLWPVFMLLPYLQINTHIIQALVLVAGIIGHIFPIQLGFKGGKGLATYLGSLVYVWIFAPLNFLVYLAIIPVILAHRKKKLQFEVKIANDKHEFEQIFSLNYATFVEEIPQHEINAERLLVDKFHENNTYIICKYGRELVGMISYCSVRPFSLDKKVPNLDTYLPEHTNICEIRLLSILPKYRRTRVCAMLFSFLLRRMSKEAIDLLIISGTTRQLDFYKKMGFQEFYHPVGTQDALYQPMYRSLKHIHAKRWQTC